MKNFLKALALCAMVALGAFAAKADDTDYLLLWAVYDPYVTNLGGGKSGYLDEFMGGICTDVRIAAHGSGGDAYLNMWYWNQSDDYGYQPEISVYGLNEYYEAGPTYANIGNYTDASWTFVMELGVYDYGTGEWTAYAFSKPYTYEELKHCPGCDNCDYWEVTGYNHIRPGELEIPDMLEWAACSFVTPEPNSGLLLLIGSALLALRRKRREA